MFSFKTAFEKGKHPKNRLSDARNARPGNQHDLHHHLLCQLGFLLFSMVAKSRVCKWNVFCLVVFGSFKFYLRCMENLRKYACCFASECQLVFSPEATGCFKQKDCKARSMFKNMLFFSPGLCTLGVVEDRGKKPKGGKMNKNLKRESTVLSHKRRKTYKFGVLFWV